MFRQPLALLLVLVACVDGLPTGEPDPSGFPRFEQGTVTSAHILGDPDADLLAGALAADAAGHLYFSGNANEWSDVFSENFALARQNADGTLGWAKEWNEEHEQLAMDAGQNGETGGTAGSVDADGSSVYAVFHRSQASTNNTFQTVVLKVAQSDGALAWARGFSPENVDPPALAWHSSDGYAVDASLADRVIVAGTSLGNAEVLVFALAKADGALLWSKQLDLAAQLNDRAHALTIDAAGNAWIGGISDGRGFLARIDGVDGSDPVLGFAKKVDLGLGSHINDLVAEGNEVFASFDVRGVDTQVAFGRFASDGSLTWAKAYQGAPGDRNNTYVVQTDGAGKLYVGGRVSVETADERFGDGLLLQVDAATGAYGWGAFYYTGKSDGEVVEHRVKGIVVDGSGDLRLLLASHAVNDNVDHYAGDFFHLMDDPEALSGDGSARLIDFEPVISDVNGVSLHDTDGSNGSNVATAHPIDTVGIWSDAPTAVTFEPLDQRTGDGVDGDAVILHLDL